MPWFMLVLFWFSAAFGLGLVSLGGFIFRCGPTAHAPLGYAAFVAAFALLIFWVVLTAVY